jgi:hypothetical protein
MPTMRATAAAALVLAGTGSLPAQTTETEPGSSAAAYFALIATPLGGLAPDVAPALTGAPATLGWRIAYAQIGDSDFRLRDLVAGIDLPLGRSQLGIDVGWNAESCSAEFEQAFGDCKGNVLGAARWSTPLLTVHPEAGRTGSAFGLGFEAGVGYARPRISELFGDVDLAAWSASVGLPAAVTARAGRVEIIPFLVPALGWGRLSASYAGESEARSGVRFMLGGGLQVKMHETFGIALGVQKVFIDGGKTALGVGLSWHALSR